MDSAALTPGALVAHALADPEAGWGVGTFGAIAEFVRDRGEAARVTAISAVTPRGGIAIHLDGRARALAWERPTARGAWQHGVAFCLPAADAAMHARRAVTPLGPDRGALRAEDRDALLFDVGLGATQCDICVRVAEPAAVRMLSAAAGRSPFDAGLLRDLAAMQPERVFVSRLARVEVRTAIPPADGATPQGPHTHVLPDLLKLGRTHPANLPLPSGWVPALELFPPAPLQDIDGRRIPFDGARHAAFQRLLEAFGDPAVLEAKRKVARAVESGRPPADDASFSRAQRLARRVALRQLGYALPLSATLAAWRGRFDTPESAREASRFCG